MSAVNRISVKAPPVSRLPGDLELTAATQARIHKGLMSERLPWQVMVYLLCVVIPVWFYAGPLYMSLLRLFLLFMIIPVMLRLLAGHYGRVIPTDWLFVAHTLWIGVSLAVTSPEYVVTQFGSVGMEFLGGYAIGRAYIRTPEAFLALCRALILIVFVLTPFAIYETRTGRPLIIDFIERLPGLRSVLDASQPKRLGLERVQGTFAHPIHFGLFCSVVFSLAFVALKGLVSDVRRWTSALIVAATGFLALSSGAFLAILLQIALIAWATAFDRIRWRWWLLTGLFALAYVVVDILSNRTPVQVFMSYATFSADTAYWRGLIFEWGLRNVLGSSEHSIPAAPLFGIGLHDWIRPEWMYTPSVDNFWLLLAMTYGLPGFFTLTLGYVLVITGVMQRNFDSDHVLAQIRRAWVFTFLGLTFTLCTVDVWSSMFSFTFFMFGTGVWLLVAKPAQTGAAGPADASSAPRPHGSVYSRFAPRQRSATT